MNRGVGEVSKAHTKTFKNEDGTKIKVPIPKLYCYLHATIRPDASKMKTGLQYVTITGVR